MTRSAPSLRASQRSLRNAFTLIEQLIVIAIVSMLSASLLVAFLFCLRLEKAISAQQTLSDTFAELDRTWRHDIHGANRVSLVSSRASDTLTTVVLIEYDQRDSRFPCRYEISPDRRGRFTLVRAIAGDRKTTTTQTLARELMGATVSLDEEKSLYELRITATAGFDVFHARQDLRIIASGKAQPIKTIFGEVPQ